MATVKVGEEDASDMMMLLDAECLHCATSAQQAALKARDEKCSFCDGKRFILTNAGAHLLAFLHRHYRVS